MKRLFGLLLLLVVFLPACRSLTPEQQALVMKAREIQHYPVKRSTLIRDLDLASIRSGRCGDGIRSECMILSETWSHPSGLRVKALDFVHIGPIAITTSIVDLMLNGVPPIPSEPTVRKSFAKIILLDPSDKVVFDSAEL